AFFPPDFSKNISSTIKQSFAAGFAFSHLSTQGCVGCDLTALHLAGHVFRGQTLTGVDFTRADLSNADFRNAKIMGGTFTKANLQGATFSGATLTGCDFTGANLSGVVFDRAEMVGCSFDAKSLTPAQLDTVLKACRMGCDFSGPHSGRSNSGDRRPPA
ncbi:MAG: pentapeptide repeat-containing protein, partial [Candidatus Eremiobacteraeota bacterium]|nr:pentapeptide repeat-containing protein [Candidatus Eremiobacteraeota bacterium]